MSKVFNLIKIPDLLDQLGKRIASAYDLIRHSREQWIEGTLDLASALAEAKTCFPSNKAFGEWLDANGHDRISHQDRAALINMVSADAIEITKDVLSKTDRRSWQHIWECEIKPRLTSASKTDEAIPDEAAPPATPPAVPASPPIAKYIADSKRFSARTKAICDSGVSEKAAELMSDLIAKLDRVIKELEAAS